MFVIGRQQKITPKRHGSSLVFEGFTKIMGCRKLAYWSEEKPVLRCVRESGEHQKSCVNWYDYGARMYNASLGRWHCVDSLAEMYYYITPYSYVGSNPIRGFDPNGMYAIYVNGEEVTGSDKAYVQRSLGLPNDSEDEDNNDRLIENYAQRVKNIFKGRGFLTDYEFRVIN